MGGVGTRRAHRPRPAHAGGGAVPRGDRLRPAGVQVDALGVVSHRPPHRGATTGDPGTDRFQEGRATRHTTAEAGRG